MTTIPAPVGLASYNSESFDVTVGPFAGKAPSISTSELLVDQGADLPQYSVVGRITASGKITLCNPAAADGSQKPIGITAVIAPRNGAADVNLPIWRDGYFRMEALNWHPGFATDAVKRLAFEVSQPTIFIRKV
jgi:hypothetical protein